MEVDVIEGKEVDAQIWRLRCRVGVRGEDGQDRGGVLLRMEAEGRGAGSARRTLGSAESPGADRERGIWSEGFLFVSVAAAVLMGLWSAEREGRGSIRAGDAGRVKAEEEDKESEGFLL